MVHFLIGAAWSLIALAIVAGAVALREVWLTKQVWSDVRDDAAMREMLVKWDERKQSEGDR